MAEHDEFLRFAVTEPDRRRVWVKYFDVPVDPQRYPIAVFTYRARNTATHEKRYSIYLDDGSGPDYGGLMPFVHQAIVADGKVRTLTYDLRTMAPDGDLIGMAVGVASNAESPAHLDLLDLRFEAAPDHDIPAVGSGEPIVVKVVDTEGHAVAGAEVAIDAERRNWKRSATTNAQGLARVVPYETKTNRHMVRVTKAGMLPMEVRDLPPRGRPIVVTLEPSVVFGGTVIDEEDQPLAGAAVHIRVQYEIPVGLWTRRDASVLNGEDGRWQALPLPKNAEWATVSLAHPRYGSQPSARYHIASEDLSSGATALRIVPRRYAFQGRITDDQGDPVPGASIRSLGSDKSVQSGPDGAFEIDIAGTGAQLLVTSDTHAPELVHVSASSTGSARPMEVRLKRGKAVRVKVIDAAGSPVAGAVVHVRGWRGQGARLVSTKTDKDGHFECILAPDTPVTAEVRADGFLPTSAELSLGSQTDTITLTPVPKKEAQDGEPPDRRRPGYDPFRIFRRLSHATENAPSQWQARVA